MRDSIFIVVNCTGDWTGPSDRARKCQELTRRRVASGVDILAASRFRDALDKGLGPNASISIHQGGAVNSRDQLDAGQLVAAGRVKELRELTEADRDAHKTDCEMHQQHYHDRPQCGIMLMDFPRGLSTHPLRKESLPYKSTQRDNFIEISSDDSRYCALDKWWNANC